MSTSFVPARRPHVPWRSAPRPSTIKSRELAREIIARRFEVYFSRLGFEPPYPTWPVRPEAFQDAGEFTPRQMLITIDAHIHDCLLSGTVMELTRLGERSEE